MENRTGISSKEWEDQFAVALEQYESQWSQLLEQLSPPDAQSFISSVQIPESLSSEDQNRLRDELWKALVSIDQAFRERLLHVAPSTDDAVFANTMIPETPAPSEESASAENIDAMAPTGEYIPQPSTDSPSPHVSTRLFVDSDSAEDHLAQTEITANTGESYPRIPGYRIDGVLGRGGMGIVYRGWQIGLNRPVALKMVLDKRQADTNMLHRFQTEAEAVAKLDHENIVKIYEIGTTEGRPFFSLEYIEGGSLDAEWDGQPLEPERCLEVALTLARAMHCAHEVGLVHRDLKPANILVRQDGLLKVTDFGLVKQIEEDSGQTEAGTVMGTPSFMAPEQARGDNDIGPAADVYGLGAILYALLTGRPPFQGPNALETILQVREAEPVPPSQLQPKIPADLETICLKALQKDIQKRYRSAEELADDLDRYQKGIPIKARPASRTERAVRWCRRNPFPALAIFLGFCLLIGALISTWAINEQRAKAVEAQNLAEDNADAAAFAQGQAEANAQQAKLAQTLAEGNENLARQQRDLAVKAFDLLAEDIPKGLKNVPNTQRFKQILLRKAMSGLNMVAGIGDASARDFVLARSHAKMGEGLMQVGETKLAQEQFQRGHEILARLSKTDRKTPKLTHQLRLGRSYRNLGLAARRLDGTNAAKTWFEKSLAERRDALTKAKDRLMVQQEIAEALGLLAEVLMAQGKPNEALELLKEALPYREAQRMKTQHSANAWREVAGITMSLGHCSNSLANHKQAADYFQKAIHLLKVLAKSPSVSARANLAIARIHLGNTMLFDERPAEAEPHFQQAVSELGSLSQSSPRDSVLKRKLSQAYYGLGVAKRPTTPSHARAEWEQSLAIRRELAKRDSSDKGFQQALMFPLARLGLVQEAAAIADRLKRELPEDSGNLYIVASCYAVCAETVQTTPAIAESTRFDVSKIVARHPPEHYEELALKTLRETLAKGYAEVHLMRVDPDLKGVRHRPEFQQILDSPLTKAN